MLAFSSQSGPRFILRHFLKVPISYWTCRIPDVGRSANSRFLGFAQPQICLDLVQREKQERLSSGPAVTAPQWL